MAIDPRAIEAAREAVEIARRFPAWAETHGNELLLAHALLAAAQEREEVVEALEEVLALLKLEPGNMASAYRHEWERKAARLAESIEAALSPRGEREGPDHG